jgi:threonine dehydratase
MHRSFAAGEPRSIDAVRTIADSLGAPYALPYTFGLCRRYVDELVMITDDEIRLAMALLFKEVKLAVEPAGAATTAALLGPLRQRALGTDVGLIVCGANTDPQSFARHVASGWGALTNRS